MNGIEIFLDGVRLSEPGGRWSFIWNKRNPNLFAGGIGFDFFIDFKKQSQSALLVIKDNPDLLSGLSIQEVSGILKDFLVAQIDFLDVPSIYFSAERDCTLLERISSEKIPLLKAKLRAFMEETLTKSMFLMPLTGINCISQRRSEKFLWLSANIQHTELIDSKKFNLKNLLLSIFPPFTDWEHRKYPLSDGDSWFAVQTIHEAKADSYFRIMTGALSVIIDYPQSRMITGREMVAGRAELKPNGSYSLNFKACMVPPVSLPLKYISDADDIFWSLCEAIDSRIHTCLEFLCESWGKSRTISFVNTSIAMDALFGQNGKVRRSILGGVEEHCRNIEFAKEKYELILDIRNDLLHGEFSTLEASPNYIKYFEQFNTNPVHNQIEILNECLRFKARQQLLPISC